MEKATFKQAGQADIIVLTAGAKQRPGETRVNLIGRNLKILKSCITESKDHGGIDCLVSPMKPEAILLLVANRNQLLLLME